MEKMLSVLAALAVTVSGLSQTDTTTQKPDTMKVGNFVIVKKDKGENSEKEANWENTNLINIRFGSNKKSNNQISTNWFIFDLGFANWRDKTSYGTPSDYLRADAGDPAFSENDFNLQNGKTTNVNLWFFMQKLNVAKHVLNLKYGLGMEMYNFRYETNVTYHKNPEYIFRDKTKTFEKNKLYAGYLTVPFMLNIDATPTKRRGFSLSAGVSAGYLIGSRNKQVSKEDGKEKIKGDLGLEKFRIAYIGELGLGPVRLYGSYSINPLHERGLSQYPYAFGIRFSNW